VPVEPGHGVEHEPARDRGGARRRINARRDATARTQLAEIERVDRRDLRAHPIELHAGHEAAPDGQLDELRALEDLEHEPRVGQVVGGEAHRIVAIGGLDLAAAVGAGHELALPEQRLRRRFEPIVLEPDVGAPNERQPVEHRAPRDRGARLAREARVALDLDLLVVPTEGEAKPGAARVALEHAEVELDDAPSRQHVGVDATDVGEKRLEDRGPVGHRLGARDRPGRGDPDVLAPRPRRRDGVERFAIEARLDVERQDGRLRRPLGRPDLRIAIDAADPRTALVGPVDAERSADPVIDAVPVREPHVGLERGHADVGETPAEDRHLGRHVELDAHQRLAGERQQRGIADGEPAEHRSRALAVARPHVAVGTEARVDDQRRLAACEHRIEVDLRPARHQPIRRRQDEPELSHG
jgi:hypothetical protein